MARSVINLEPQILDLTLYAGDGLNFSLVVTDTLNAAIPLTGTMRAHVRVNRLDPDPPVEVFEIDLTQSAAGIARLSLTGMQTQALSDSTPPTEKFTGEWDAEWTPTAGQPITLCQGKVECMPDVSH